MFVIVKNFNKLLFALLITGLLVGCVNPQTLEQDIDNIRQDQQAQQGKMSKIEDDVDKVDQKINEVQKLLESQIQPLNEEMTKLKEEIVALKKEVKRLERRIR